MVWYAPRNPTTSNVSTSLWKLDGGAEADGQIDLSEGLDSLARRDAVERRHAGKQLVQADPHELQCVRVQNVEASASVHEHLGEPGVADDRIHDDRVLTRVWDVIGVVFAAEGDGVL